MSTTNFLLKTLVLKFIFDLYLELIVIGVGKRMIDRPVQIVCTAGVTLIFSLKIHRGSVMKAKTLGPTLLTELCRTHMPRIVKEAWV